MLWLEEKHSGETLIPLLKSIFRGSKQSKVLREIHCNSYEQCQLPPFIFCLRNGFSIQNMLHFDWLW